MRFSPRRRPVIFAVGVAVILLPAGGEPARADHVWHVVPTGNDGNPGTQDRPLATLEGARDRIREAGGGKPAADAGPHTILLGSGLYRRTAPLDLDERDCGITVRGPPDRSARLHAGRAIPASAVHLVTDAAMRSRLDRAAVDHVVAIDFASAGVRAFKPPPAMFTDGGGMPDLYLDDAPLPLSRWPNEGSALMEKVLDRGVWSGKPEERRGGTFVSALDPRGEWRPKRWRAADGVWLEGYWRVPWAPQAVRIAAIDPANRTITHAVGVHGGIGSKYAAKGSLGDGKEPWCAVNLPEEIDLPGEWCLDCARQVIYLWPPRPLGDVGDGGLIVADQMLPLIRIREARDVRIERLTIEGGLGNGVEIVGGSGNTVAGCLLRNLGGTAVTVLGGNGSGVRSCDIRTIGEAGIRLAGGDRTSLSPCGNFAVNNDVSDVGRRRKTWAAAIHVGSPVGHFDYVDAVGCRVAHNFLHDLPHSAVLYDGNDHVLEANEVCRVALTSGDVGAFYTRQDWTSRGNVLRHNLVHDCPRANAFYVDDGDSGDLIEENIVVRAACGPFIGGGHDNVVRHNVVVDCPVGIHFDSRGVSRGYAENPRYRSRVESVLSAAAWVTRFPAVARLIDPALDADGVVGAPHGNVFVENVTVGCQKPERFSGKPEELRDNRVEGNIDLAANAAPFVDAARGDFRLDPRADLFRRLPSFPKIPADIGLERDDYRTSLPPRAGQASAATAPGFDSATDLNTTNRDATNREAPTSPKAR